MARTKMTDAAKAEDRILKTRNREWGFYGTISSDPRGRGLNADAAWTQAMEILTNRGGFFKLTPEAARDMLDSTWGRHVADEIVDSTNTEVAMTIDETLDRIGRSRREMRAIRERTAEYNPTARAIAEAAGALKIAASHLKDALRAFDAAGEAENREAVATIDHKILEAQFAIVELSKRLR